MTQPTNRVRLYGGRNTHTAQSGRMGHITPCGYPVGRHDHWLPNNATVTCPQCIRRMAEEARS